MAFAVDVFANTRPIGTSISRFSRSFRLISNARLISAAGLIGAGFAASAWVVTTVATMHAIAPSPYQSAIRDIALTSRFAAVAPAKERNIHIAKFSRLGTPTVEDLQVIAERGRANAHSALAKALVGQSGPLVADATPAPAATIVANAAPARARNDTVPTAANIANAAATDRIIIPSKAEIAATEGPALLALAAMPTTAIPSTATPSTVMPSTAVPSPTEPNRTAAIPARQAAVEVASVAVGADASSDDNRQPFGLVLNDSDASVPLPMARPDGMSKRAPVNDRAARPAEPALAYASPDIGDDEGEIPVVPKRQASPVARNGVAIYDISANIVYLPNGERLEAHSGLGKMRDNPRFVHEKNRGPTPPHTYQLTMRESLFHGVEAIRLNPLGGAGNIYNRVGLLAHTYMLGARGDSNGCVSFKDYKRFLAAFKRGDIRQLVVVTSMPDKPKSTFASLFSSRS
jgi:hypothetical protein